MPCAFMKAISRLTSAMTSGPMPSPASRSNLWVGMGPSLDLKPRGLLMGCTSVGKACARGGNQGRYRCVDVLRLRRAEASANPMSEQRPKVVSIGAGFGGIEAAMALARAPLDVTVIDQNNYHCFQPLLYQVTTAVLSPAEVAWPVRHILRGQR